MREWQIKKRAVARRQIILLINEPHPTVVSTKRMRRTRTTMRAVENRSDYLWVFFFLSRNHIFKPCHYSALHFKPRENRGIQPAGAKRNALACDFFQVSCVFDGICRLRLTAYIFDEKRAKFIIILQLTYRAFFVIIKIAIRNQY